MILGLQILAILFAMTMVYFAMIHYKKSELLQGEFLAWVFIWALVVFAALFPEILRTYAQEFFLTRLFDLLVIGAFIVIISMVSIIYVKVKDLEKKMTKLVRKDAFKKVK
jgi:hypothetical protein